MTTHRQVQHLRSLVLQYGALSQARWAAVIEAEGQKDEDGKRAERDRQLGEDLSAVLLHIAYAGHKLIERQRSIEASRN